MTPEKTTQAWQQILLDWLEADDAAVLDFQGNPIPDRLTEVLTGWVNAPNLAAALKAVMVDGHPIYPSTAGWRGGVGGQAVTQGCSIIDPPPYDEPLMNWAEDVLRRWLIQDGRVAQVQQTVQAHRT